MNKLQEQFDPVNPAGTSSMNGAALHAAFANALMVPQNPRALMGGLLATVSVALYILPQTSAGVQVAVAILATEMPFLILFASLRSEKRLLVQAVHAAQREAEQARKKADEARKGKRREQRRRPLAANGAARSERTDL